MRVVERISDLLAALRAAERPLGLVPTMGFLHDGHLSLARRARAENATVAVSIFVNPVQFGPHEDLERYPRDLSRDLRLLEAEKVDLVFCPSMTEMYPSGFDSYVEVGTLASRLEGAARPGHFRGVCTVVLKLFNLTRPERSYFGQKDAQQVLVVKRMSGDLNTGVNVVVCPTVREPDGLALSSRNVYLDAQERQAALVLYRSLRKVQELFAGGQHDAEALRRGMRAVLEAEPKARVEYVSVADTETLEELDEVRGPALVSLAVRIGTTRLIDNVVLAGSL